MQNPVDSFDMALRTARKERNLTQKELAEILHMSVRTIIEAECGHSNPKFETIALLAKELNQSGCDCIPEFHSHSGIQKRGRLLFR